MNRSASPVNFLFDRSRLLVWFICLFTGLSFSCGHVRPVPEGFNPEDYAFVTIKQLTVPRQAGLFTGQKVWVEGYFWQYLDYDPFMVANYVTMARQPVAWSRLRWASLYHHPQMQGYYDRLAMTRQQQQDWRLKRLERLRVYGQLASLGFGVMYLQVHQLERLDLEEDSLNRGHTAPAGHEEIPKL